MRAGPTTGAAAALLAIASPAAAGGHHGWDRASSIGRDVLVAAALGVPAVQGDWRGDVQAGASILAAGGLGTGLKAIFPERRPDGSDRKSFPSAHSSVAFAAAATLENRYGWQAGAPALLVATFVGVARIAARKHHWYDVAAGAGIGTATGLLITSRRDERVRLVPWAGGGGGGGGLTALARF